MYWNLIINFDWNIIEIEIAKYKHSTELSCNITTLPVGLSDTQIGVCRVYVFMYGLRRLSRVEVKYLNMYCSPSSDRSCAQTLQFAVGYVHSCKML